MDENTLEMEPETRLPGDVWWVGEETDAPDYRLDGKGMWLEVGGVVLHIFRPYKTDDVAVEAFRVGHIGCRPLNDIYIHNQDVQGRCADGPECAACEHAQMYDSTTPIEEGYRKCPDCGFVERVEHPTLILLSHENGEPFETRDFCSQECAERGQEAITNHFDPDKRYATYSSTASLSEAGEDTRCYECGGSLAQESVVEPSALAELASVVAAPKLLEGHIQAAQKQYPRILLLTPGTEDPFEARHFCSYTCRALGLEDITYHPDPDERYTTFSDTVYASKLDLGARCYRCDTLLVSVEDAEGEPADDDSAGTAHWGTDGMGSTEQEELHLRADAEAADHGEV